MIVTISISWAAASKVSAVVVFGRVNCVQPRIVCHLPIFQFSLTRIVGYHKTFLGYRETFVHPSAFTVVDATVERVVLLQHGQ